MGGALIALFVAIERRATQPITPLRLFASRERSGAYVARALVVTGMFGMFFFVTQFLQGVLHFSPLQAGIAFLPTTAVMFATVQVVPRIASRVGEFRLLASGVATALAGMVWLSRLSPSTHYFPQIAIPMALLGLGIGTALIPLTGLGIRGVAPEDAGAASGLINVSQQIGASLGLSILVTRFAAAAHNGSDAELKLAHGVAAALTGSTVFLTIALAVVLDRAANTPRRRTDTRPRTETRGSTDGSCRLTIPPDPPERRSTSRTPTRWYARSKLTLSGDLTDRGSALVFGRRAGGFRGGKRLRRCTENSHRTPSSAPGCGTSMENVNASPPKRGTAMTLATTSPQIGSSSTPLPVHDDQPRSSSDHWQVSQYFPLRPVGSAPRWSRASNLSEQPATALNGGRGLEAGKAVAEAPRERLGRPVAASGPAPRLRRPSQDGRAGQRSDGSASVTETTRGVHSTPESFASGNLVNRARMLPYRRSRRSQEVDRSDTVDTFSGIGGSYSWKPTSTTTTATRYGSSSSIRPVTTSNGERSSRCSRPSGR